MRTVYKYPFFGSPGNTVYIALPEGAEIVRFALQDRTPTMWAIVDSDKPFVQRLFSVIGTGWAIPDGAATSEQSRIRALCGMASK